MAAMVQVPEAPLYYSESLPGEKLPSLPSCLIYEGSQIQDAELLLDFKASLANGEEVLTSWLVGTDPCQWEGVVCETDSKTKFNQITKL